jgi:hypothetical protein
MSTNNGKQRIFVAGYRSAANCSFVPIPDDDFLEMLAR